MEPNRSAMAIIAIVMMVFTVASSSDMSIISYDRTHADKSAWRSDEEVMSMYEEWLVKQGKLYNAMGEKEKRFEIFKDNLRFIEEHNAENRTYKLGLSRFADLSNEEYRSKYLGTRIDPKRKITRSNRYAPSVADNLHKSVDWRKEGARVVKIDDYEEVPLYDESALKKAVANQPVSVAIEAAGREFQLYTSGIFTGRCGTSLDHGVAAVGYGTENGVDYWIVRNSWGKSWGEAGYIRMERNLATSTAGKCGIAMQSSYPIKKRQNAPYHLLVVNTTAVLLALLVHIFSRLEGVVFHGGVVLLRMLTVVKITLVGVIMTILSAILVKY